MVKLTVDQTQSQFPRIISPLLKPYFSGDFLMTPSLALPLPLRNCTGLRLWCRSAVMPTTWSFSQSCNWVFAPEALLAPNLSDLTLKLSEVREAERGPVFDFEINAPYPRCTEWMWAEGVFCMMHSVGHPPSVPGLAYSQLHMVLAGHTAQNLVTQEHLLFCVCCLSRSGDVTTSA